MFQDILNTIPEGHSKAKYQNKSYGLIKTIFNKGKSIKLYAKQLGGNNFISCNFYKTKEGVLLKPCEMPKAKIIAFLNNLH